VAIGIGARDIVAGNQARAAGTILDHDRLTERIPDRGLQDARGDIHVSARRIRHHHGDGLGWESLRDGWLRQHSQAEEAAQDRAKATHCVPPRFSFRCRAPG
jgi:hypothetical protein